jgi:peptidylprolyl isomerase/FKBP-type peptidyl-prolyl cis-trans isomerase FklB
MRPGDEWILYVPPELGYGDQGAGDTIPPGAALIFRIELIDFLPGPGRTANG